MKTFGDYEVRYGSVIDHDVYKYLCVSIEVPRGEKENGFVYLNGALIGAVKLVNGRFVPYRFKTIRNKQKEVKLDTITPEIGKAVAAIISDYIV